MRVPLPAVEVGDAPRPRPAERGHEDGDADPQHQERRDEHDQRPAALEDQQDEHGAPPREEDQPHGSEQRDGARDGRQRIRAQRHDPVQQRGVDPVQQRGRAPCGEQREP
jgi:hypothetical protein